MIQTQKVTFLFIKGERWKDLLLVEKGLDKYKDPAVIHVALNEGHSSFLVRSGNKVVAEP
jgi:hypothetical protein